MKILIRKSGKQWLSNIIANNGEIIYTGERVKNLNDAISTGESLIKEKEKILIFVNNEGKEIEVSEDYKEYLKNKSF